MATTLKVKIIPNASREGISGWYGDMLKVKVMQPPEDGRANKALLELLANSFNVPIATVNIINGYSSQIKTIQFQDDIKFFDFIPKEIP